MKVDASKDYYADLEVAPDCSDEEIKKQYRKLALLYHPDRNRGKEAECSARFQAVQAAHEVLGDPDSRSKYDQARRRGTVHTTFERPAGPKGRAPPNKPPPDASHFPPPPRRTGPPRPDIPPSGAERYQNFAPPPPRREHTGAKSDARDRANMFNAWKHMNSNQKTQPPPRSAPPQAEPRAGPPPPPRFKPGHSPQDSHGASFPSRGDDLPPRSAYEQVNRQRPSPMRNPSSFESMRKTGYNPHSLGDENPVTNPTMYASTQRYDRATNSRSGNGVSSPHPAPTAKKMDTSQVPFTEAPRERAPYASGVNEKTYLSSENMRRSASHRESPTRRPADQPNRGVSFQDPTPQGRRNSSSPLRRQSTEERNSARSAPHSPYSHPSERKGSHNDKTSKGYFVYDSSDNSDGTSSPPPDFPTARRHSSHGTGVSTSSHGSGIPDTSHRPKAQPSAAWINRSAQDPKTRAKSMDEPDVAADESILSKDETTTSRVIDPVIRDFKPSPEASRTSQTRSDSPEPPPLRRAATTYGFSTSQRTDIHARSSNPEMRGRKPDNGTNTRFNQYKTSDGTRPTNESIPRTESHPDTFASHSQRYRSKNADYNEQSRQSPTSPMPPPNSAPAGGGSTFPADHWARTMQEDNWASRWADAPAPGTSPTRPNSARHRTSRTSNPTKARTFPTATIHDQEDAEAGLAGPSPSVDPYDNESDAMDIDDDYTSSKDTQKPSVTNAQEDAQTGARPVFVEPSRPEWRDGYGSNQTLEPPPNVERRHSHPSEAVGPQARSPLERPSSNITMDDFRHVAPLSGRTTGDGLGDMKDLTTDLPFTSQPAAVHPSRPLQNNDTSVKVELPKPPRAPLPPSRHSKAMWETYLGELRYYIHAWNSFNTTMANILCAKAVYFTDMEKGPSGGMVSNWLSAVGETEALGGWDTYTRKLREEEKCRVYWNVAAERHRDAVQRHERLRKAILNNGFQE